MHIHNRLVNIDILRGLAALAVGFFHFRRDMLGTGYNTLANYGLYGVDVFFVISGFVIPLALRQSQFTYLKIISFWVSRFVRLYPAYIFSSFFAIGLWYASSFVPGFRGPPPPSVTLEQFFSNLGLLCDLSGHQWFLIVSWSLAIEAQFYLCIAIMFPLFINPRLIIQTFALMFWLACPLVFRDFHLVFYWNALFGMGLAVMLYQQKLLHCKALVFFLLISWAIQWETRNLVSALVGLGAAIFICCMPKLKAKSLIWLGGISYSFYLVHAPIGSRVMNFFERYPDSPVALLISVPLALASSVLVAYVFFKVVEWPSHKLSRVLRDKLE
jgi:peptidoglycan/LPS O-acetylase OafA/YrhL